MVAPFRSTPDSCRDEPKPYRNDHNISAAVFKKRLILSHKANDWLFHIMPRFAAICREQIKIKNTLQFR
jgi:hypothetical protein